MVVTSERKMLEGRVVILCLGKRKGMFSCMKTKVKLIDNENQEACVVKVSMHVEHIDFFFIWFVRWLFKKWKKELV